MANKLVCAGFGQLNSRVATLWQQEGGQVHALRLSKAESNNTLSFSQIDLSTQHWPDTQAQVVVVALSAQQRSLEAYRAAYIEPLLQLEQSLANWQRPPEKILVVSSTRVYGFDDGRTVTDETRAQTEDAYGQILLSMEAIVARLPAMASVLRLSGIYAPHRDWLKRMALKASDEQLQKNHWTNRIHIDDAARAIMFLSQQPNLASSYIISDCEPVPAIEIYNYFRQRHGAALLQKKLPTNRGKRVIPSRLTQLGFQWQYPNAFSGGYEV